MVRPVARSLFRVMPTMLTSIPKLSFGIPFQFHLDRSAPFADTQMAQFIPTSTDSLDVVVTQLSGTNGVGFLVTAPQNVSDEDASRVWKSFGDDDVDSFNDKGFVSFNPLDTELNKVFTIIAWLSPGANVSDCVLFVGDTASSDTPIQLINGLPTNEQVELHQEKYFVLKVTPGLAKDVTISLNALTGDPDIYVNPAPRGFYHRGSVTSSHPDPAAAWSSTMPSGLSDSLVISHSDELFGSANGMFNLFSISFRKQ